MKKLAPLFLVYTLLIGCKAWDISSITVKKEPLSPRLLTLEKRMEDIESVAVEANDERARLFTKEVEENLTDPFGEKYGHIIMKQSIIKYNSGTGWFIPNAFTLFLPALLGFPVSHDRYILEVELRITDAKNKLIGKYSAIGTGSAWAALYYGYTIENARKKSYVDAVNQAFDQIRLHIQKDAASLNEKLKTARKS